jgi:hypothetical protein
VTWVLLVAVLAASGCAHREQVKASCLFPELNPCPTNHACRLVKHETHPELLEGSYVCVPLFPPKVRGEK